MQLHCCRTINAKRINIFQSELNLVVFVMRNTVILYFLMIVLFETFVQSFSVIL